MYAVECFVLFDDVSISKDQSQICHKELGSNPYAGKTNSKLVRRFRKAFLAFLEPSRTGGCDYWAVYGTIGCLVF